MAGARSGGGRRGGGGGGSDWTPSPAFLEQPLERESTLKCSRPSLSGGGCGGGPLEAHNPTPKNTHRKIKVHKKKWLHEWDPEKGRTHPKA